jgi:hypothetical protein
LRAASLGLCVLLAGIPTASWSQSSPPPTCITEQYRQFDFWVGQWDVYDPRSNQLVAHSNIEKLYDGCAIRENWEPLNGKGGGSLNSYRADRKEWLQVWTDWQNSLNEYRGGLENGSMVMTGTSTSASGKDTAARMTFEPQKDGSVIQTGYGSADGGKTWQLNYQFVYRTAGASQQSGKR